MSLRLEIDEELEKKFREEAMKEFGYSKGALTKASEEAFAKWIAEKRTRKPIRKVNDPIKLIDGVLSQYRGKMTSVEMQHETRKLWAKKDD